MAYANVTSSKHSAILLCRHKKSATHVALFNLVNVVLLAGSILTIQVEHQAKP